MTRAPLALVVALGVALGLAIAACNTSTPSGPTLASYFASTGPGPQTGGVKMIPINT